jgi:hypothetical protein
LEMDCAHPCPAERDVEPKVIGLPERSFGKMISIRMCAVCGGTLVEGVAGVRNESESASRLLCDVVELVVPDGES